MAMTPYEELLTFQRETEALGQISQRLGWDQETVMPRSAAPQRAEEMSAITSVLHARRSSPQVGEWLDHIDPGRLTSVEAAQVRLIARSFERATKVPGPLAAAIAAATSKAQVLWADAREDEDVSAFLPLLEEVLALKREEAEALAGAGSHYDALLQDFEPEMSAVELEAMFAAMRPRIVALRDAIVDAEARNGDRPEVSGTFDDLGQMRLAARIARAFGYDFDYGRIDKAVHPFSSGSGLDVRITTRTSVADPFNCIYSTVHETGHAMYELGIADDHRMTPVGRGVSMGVHESQSRIFENQLARGRAFCGWLFDAMRGEFGELGVDSEDAFYAAVNRVGRGFIRTEADEVQYNLHIMLRFDLERALLSGDLLVADLEAAWNDRFKDDFGFAVDKPSNGCLQDVHWSVGLFGYFPTYSLGNVYAGCLYAAMDAALPELATELRSGNTSSAVAWLREKVHQHGGLRGPRATIEHATGEAISPELLLDYLEAKFGDLYGL